MHLHQRFSLCTLPVVVALMACTHKTDAFRSFSAKDKAAAIVIASSQTNTSYGQPKFQVQTKSVSVDHFGSAQYTRNVTFEQRFELIWPVDEPNDTTPIFLFCGQEKTLANLGVGIGYYSNLANATGALQIWAEHRYYADELPFYPDDNFEHFTIEQSLVDHIELVLFIQSVTGLTKSPVIALGSSYSAQLAQWLRMRYPDVIAGAISSSPTSLGCPGLGLDPSYDPYGYYKAATRAASTLGGSAPACVPNVQKFFQTLFSLASNSSGLDEINDSLGLCDDSRVATYDDVNQTLALYVREQWRIAAQYNSPLVDANGVPGYRVRLACEQLSDPDLAGPDLLEAMVGALSVFDNNASIAGGCWDTTGASANPEGPPEPEAETEPEAAPEEEAVADSGVTIFPPTASNKFDFQVCTQDQTPVSSDGVSDMFYDKPFDVDATDEACYFRFGVHSQYNWAAANFGLSAIRQSSNIFFTNGWFDPFIACGPTVNISDTIIAAVYEGCHAGDFSLPDAADPPSVTAVRQQGAALIAQWVAEYNLAKTQVPLSNAADVFNLDYGFGGYTENVNDTLAGAGYRRTQVLLGPSAAYSNSLEAL